MVVDDFIGAERADEINVFGAGHGRDGCTEPLGDLHRKRTDAASGAVDDNTLANGARVSRQSNGDAGVLHVRLSR